MINVKEYISKLINKIFDRNKDKLPIGIVDKEIKYFEDSNIIKSIENDIEKSIDLNKIDNLYFDKLKNENHIYNFKLETKLDEKQVMELTKDFFLSIDKNIFDKVNNIIEGNDDRVKLVFEQYGKSKNEDGQYKDSEVTNLKEVYIASRGDLRDVYSTVHELTHTLDLNNNDTDARKIYGEIVPQCMERMLDDYLIGLDSDHLNKYSLDKDILNRDINNRKVSTFLSRKDNIKAFNRNKGNKLLNLRYSIAQIYSSKFF